MNLAIPTTSRRAAPSAARDSLRLAAIDIGSNSVHMIVAQVDPDGAVTTLWRMKEMVGLGRLSFPSHKLARESMDNAVTVLRRFQQAAQQRQAEKLIAVATSAVREAVNGGDFIERVKRELGLYVRVISARDEARLIYLAVRHAMDLRDRPHLIVDVGGGSVEFIVGDARHAHVLESRKLGAARMSAKFVKSDPISQSDQDKLRHHYEEMLGPLCETILAHKPIKVIGTSGTLECIATLCGSTAETNGDRDAAPAVIEREEFEPLLARLIESDSKERSRMRGLDDQRREQIVAGAMLVDELFNRLHIKRIQICGSALREGVLLDYLARHVPEMTIRRQVPDPRRRSVLDLARKCDWHKTHSEHVAGLCLQLYDDLRPLHGLGSVERELIEFGALLHDIGWHIGRSGHHKHGMYLIANGDLKEFAPEEIQIVAQIARYHRKSPPKKSHEQYVSLSAWGRRVVDVGAALLRLADGLDRSHVSAITKLSCRIRERQVKCVLTAKSDAELEIWGARRKMKLFEKVFGRRISFEIAKR